MSALDPGRNAPTREPHAGDEHAGRIRAALERLTLPPEQRVAKERTVEEEAALAEPRVGRWVVGEGWVPVDGGGPYEGVSRG